MWTTKDFGKASERKRKPMQSLRAFPPGKLAEQSDSDEEYLAGADM